MDVADHLRLREREEVAVVQQVLLRVLEALAADVRLGHPVGADGRAHRAVDDGDALSEQLFERVDGIGDRDTVRPLCVSSSACAACGLSAMASTTCRCGFLALAAGDLGRRRRRARRAPSRRAQRRAARSRGGARRSGAVTSCCWCSSRQSRTRRPPGPQHARALRERARRVLGVGQRVEDEHGVERRGRGTAARARRRPRARTCGDAARAARAAASIMRAFVSMQVSERQ